jgi:hypothetical protein
MHAECSWGRRTEKETTLARTWKIETRKQTSLVSPSKCPKLLLISCSVPPDRLVIVGKPVLDINSFSGQNEAREMI